jgi:hypothetical protein
VAVAPSPLVLVLQEQQILAAAVAVDIHQAVAQVVLELSSFVTPLERQVLRQLIQLRELQTS